MVRSAATSVSNTFLKPRRRSAAAILPVTEVPIGMPNSSPSAARTAGAGCTTTYFSGSDSASKTSAVSSFSVSAPVGHTAMHWPQLMQPVSARPMFQAGRICVLKPRFTGPMTPTDCTLLQTATQRRHSTHFALLRTMATEELSTSVSVMGPAKRASSSTPYSRHSACSSQLVERTQLRQRLSWLESKSSRFTRRALRIAGVFVFTSTTSPVTRFFGSASTGYTQAACSARPPASTTHIRHAPISLISFI